MGQMKAALTGFTDQTVELASLIILVYLIRQPSKQKQGLPCLIGEVFCKVTVLRYASPNSHLSCQQSQGHRAEGRGVRARGRGSGVYILSNHPTYLAGEANDMEIKSPCSSSKRAHSVNIEILSSSDLDEQSARKGTAGWDAGSQRPDGAGHRGAAGRGTTARVHTGKKTKLTASPQRIHCPLVDHHRGTLAAERQGTAVCRNPPHMRCHGRQYWGSLKHG